MKFLATPLRGRGLMVTFLAAGHHCHATGIKVIQLYCLVTEAHTLCLQKLTIMFVNATNNATAAPRGAPHRQS